MKNEYYVSTPIEKNFDWEKLDNQQNYFWWAKHNRFNCGYSTKESIQSIKNFDVNILLPSDKVEQSAEEIKIKIQRILEVYDYSEEDTIKYLYQFFEEYLLANRELPTVSDEEIDVAELKESWNKRSDYIKTKNVNTDEIFNFFLPYLSTAKKEKEIEEKCDEKMLYHTCGFCGWRCNCSTQPCSCNCTQ
jgi:hypothetical protein